MSTPRHLPWLVIGTLGLLVAGSCASTDDKPARRAAVPFPDIVVDGAPAEQQEKPADEDPTITPPEERERQIAEYAKGGPEPLPALRERPELENDDQAPENAPSVRVRDRRARPPKMLRRSPPADKRMRVHALDVGQGTAVLLEFACGVALVDTGGEQNAQFSAPVALKRQLDAFFEERKDLNRTIDLLVLSHPHIDHLRGIPTLLKNYRVKNVIDNGSEGDELVAKEIGALRQYVAEHNVGYRAARLPDIHPTKGWTDEVIDPINCQGAVDPEIRVLYGSSPQDPGWGIDFYGQARFDDENNHSVVLRVAFGKSAVLVTGDLEEVAIDEMIERTADSGLLQADAYLVGHHGSHNGTTRELMEEVDPQVAVISMGPASREEDWSAWRYGHPRAGIVRMLANTVSQQRPATRVLVARYGRRFDPLMMTSAVYGTGWDGVVIVELDDKRRLRVLTEKKRAGDRVSQR